MEKGNTRKNTINFKSNWKFKSNHGGPQNTPGKLMSFSDCTDGKQMHSILSYMLKKLKPLTGLLLNTFVPHSLSFDLVLTFCPETCVSKKETTLLSEAL